MGRQSDAGHLSPIPEAALAPFPGRCKPSAAHGPVRAPFGRAPARGACRRGGEKGDRVRRSRTGKKAHDTLQKPKGPITLSDAESLDELNIANAGENIPDGERVRDISALAHFSNLYAFTAFNTAISDISPLASLRGMKYLDLGRNKISGLSPLSGLTSLEYPDLSDNQIADLSPLDTLAPNLNHQNQDACRQPP